MKKSVLIFLSAAVILGLAGCAGAGTGRQQDGDADTTPAGSQSAEIEPAATAAAQSQAAQTPQYETAVSNSQVGQPTAAPSDGQASQLSRTQGITEEDAKRIALDHAKASEGDVSYMQVKLERDHGRDEYDVEFYVGNQEYDYEIDAATGEILSYDYDAESYTPPAAPNQAGSGAVVGSQGQDGTSYITREQAKAAAFAHANVSETDVYKLKVELDQDHGRAEYEVEFEAGHTEYEYEVDAVTGEIISFDVDRD